MEVKKEIKSQNIRATAPLFSPLGGGKETIPRNSEENSRCWRFLADRIIILDYAKEADRVTI